VLAPVATDDWTLADLDDRIAALHRQFEAALAEGPLP